MNSNDQPGIFMNGLRMDLKKEELKRNIIRLMYVLNVPVQTSNIRVIPQKNKTFAFVNLDTQDTVDYILNLMSSERGRSTINFNFSHIASGSSDFYISRIKNKASSSKDRNKITSRKDDRSNNGFISLNEKFNTVTTGTSVQIRGLSTGSHLTVDTGRSGHSLGLSSHPDIIHSKRNPLHAATSVSGLGPSVHGKFYRHDEKLGNETRNVEFKEGKGNYRRDILSDHVGKYVCGFVNSLEGGTLFVGVNDLGMVQGIICSHEEEDNLRLRLDEAVKIIEPSVFPQMYSVAFTPVLLNGSFSDNLKVLEIIVHPSKSRDDLYEFKGSVFVRRDGSIQCLKARDIKAWARNKAAGELAHSHLVTRQLDEVSNQLHQLQTQLTKKRDKKSRACQIL